MEVASLFFDTKKRRSNQKHRHPKLKLFYIILTLNFSFYFDNFLTLM